MPSLHRKDVLDLDDFTPEEIELVLDTTDAMREVLGRPIKRVPALRGKTIVNLFYEASTRTRVSFELAAKNLSADVVNVSVSGSSVEKGESLLDTICTLQALGADIIVMRHHQSGAPYMVARHMAGSVINAGDGWHAHPTQALLDLYTIREHLGQIKDVSVVIVGDVLHSRVARSNLWGMTKLGAKVTVCGPPTLLPSGDWVPMEGVTVTHHLDHVLSTADVVMPLRLQKERMQSGLLPSLREYARLYQVNEARMGRCRPGTLVMHPGPMNEGVEISAEVAHGAQSVIEEQVSNGVAVRMALLYLLAGAIQDGNHPEAARSAVPTAGG
ncbi:MAG: aspartate carbamoyltransferase catalytic subunit [Bacteroidetes bacterium]|nr:aspartate carbamoyltransferase catalytic subunit [Bacteroidota bacterium]